MAQASTAALLEMPLLNAVFDLPNREVLYRDYVDVSVAVQAEGRGLVVPVLRDAHKMSFAVSVLKWFMLVFMNETLTLCWYRTWRSPSPRSLRGRETAPCLRGT